MGMGHLMNDTLVQRPTTPVVGRVDDDAVFCIAGRAIVDDPVGFSCKTKTYLPAFAVDDGGCDLSE